MVNNSGGVAPQGVENSIFKQSKSMLWETYIDGYFSSQDMTIQNEVD